ncbi:AAA family ATPase [Kitasatospora sp. NPDC056327]|uniref:AAA family ATPase n=1 Tax=Kitasatospora sp. NPDC056327 TaxID=3345785 RepID=UPI0035D6804B
MTGTTASDVFIDRTTELARLGVAWRQATAQGARAAGVAGPAGIGKTALLRLFRSGLPADSVAWSSGDWEDEFGGPRPWGVVAQLLAGLAGPGGPARLPGPDPTPVYAADWLAGRLRAAGRPLALVVDDAHRADEPSMVTLRLTVRLLEDTPVLVVLGYQENPHPAGASADGPVPALHPGWLRLFASERGLDLRLGRFGPDEVEDLAVACGRPGLTGEAAARLCEHTDGNPQHLTELLRQLTTHELVHGDGRPTLRTLPASVLARRAGLSAPARALLDAGAVLGRRFTLADARELLDPSPGHGFPGHVPAPRGPHDDAPTRHPAADAPPWTAVPHAPHAPLPGTDVPGSAAVDEAVTAGLLEEVPGSAGRDLAFSTALVRDSLYGALTATRRRALHARAGARGGAEALWHRLSAAEGPDDALAAALAEAARDHLAKGRLRLAAGCAKGVLFTTRPGPRRAADLLHCVEILLIAGDAHTALGHRAEVEALPAGPWRDYVLGYLTLLRGEPDAARERLLAALTALDSAAPGTLPDPAAPRDLEARICAQLGVLAVVSLDYGGMEEFGARGVRACWAGPTEPFVSDFAWLARSLGTALAGRSEEALASLVDADRAGTPAGLDGLVARGMIRLWTDDLPGAAADLSGAVRRAVRGEPLRVAQALAYLGETEYRRGALEAAVRHTALAVGDATENDRFWDLSLVNALACYPLAALGRPEEAAPYLEEAERWAFASRVGAAYTAAARAALAQAAGDLPALLRAAEELDLAYDSREPGTHLFGPLRADALVLLGRTDEAERELTAYLDRHRGSPRRSTEAAVQRVRAGIAAARGDSDRARVHAQQAVAAADATGLPLEAARAGLVLAEVLHGAGHRAAAGRILTGAVAAFRSLGAAAYAERAVELAERLGLGTEPDDGPAALLHGLTRAELGTARLVAEGLSNEEVARRRTTTVGTVTSTLNAVYAKLDIEGVRGEKRRELTRLIRAADAADRDRNA